VDVPIHLKLVKASNGVNNLTIRPEFDSYGRIVAYNISGAFAAKTSSFKDPLQANALVSEVPVHLGLKWLQNLFTIMLKENGILLSPSAAVIASANEHFSVDLSSESLLRILTVGVQNSINGILDRIYFEIALRLNSVHASDPSFQILEEMVQDDSLLQGIQIYDGSGLSIADRIRPKTIKLFLERLQKQSYFQDFLTTLAVAGQSGTLVSRLTDTLTRGKIFGKTGTIDGVYNLVGYFLAPDQHLEPFAIITKSNLDAATVRTMIDNIVLNFAGLNSQATKAALH
jgi:D-alanyl-D-alanine carboxypeptidase/D-alanyl-D-alanine-endopeptidase (penicillin-binding protein 4)